VLTKFTDLSQRGFDPAREIIPFGLCHPQFLAVALPYLGSSLSQLNLETRPRSLVLTGVLALAQAERFLCGQLCDTGKVFDAESIQNFGAAEFASTSAKRAFDFSGRR
jgi:hypothetical protein